MHLSRKAADKVILQQMYFGAFAAWVKLRLRTRGRKVREFPSCGLNAKTTDCNQKIFRGLILVDVHN